MKSLEELSDVLHERPDNHTFCRVCAILEQMFQSSSTAYRHAVEISLSLVSQIAAQECRLPGTIGANAICGGKRPGFWPVLRSLGFEAYGELGWQPTLLASELREEVPEVLSELSLTVDDIDRARSFLVASKVRVLRVEIKVSKNSEDLLRSLPETVTELTGRGLTLQIELPANIRRFDTLVLPEIRFRELLARLPDSIVELGPSTLIGEGDRLVILCENHRILNRLTHLTFSIPHLTDRTASVLSDARLPNLEHLDLVAAQPSELDGEILTPCGAEALSSAGWWSRLQSIRLRGLYSDEVAVPLLSRIQSGLKDLFLAQDDQYSNPHESKTGLSDNAILSIPLDAFLSIESIVLENTQVDGTFFSEWSSYLQRKKANGPRIMRICNSPLDKFEHVAQYLRSNAMKSLEVLDLSWPSYTAAQENDIAEAISSSKTCPGLRTLVLEGWQIDSSRLSALLGQTLFVESLESLHIGLDPTEDDQSKLVKVFSAMFNSPLGKKIRILHLSSLKSAEAVCLALEHCRQKLNLRVLQINSKHANLESIARLARSKALSNLWRLVVIGDPERLVRNQVASSRSAERALKQIGMSEAFSRVYEITLENVCGFDKDTIPYLFESQLPQRLLVLPGMHSHAKTWLQCKSLSPLVRKAIELHLETVEES